MTQSSSKMTMVLGPLKKSKGRKEIGEVARKCIEQKREKRKSWEFHPTLVCFSQEFVTIFIVIEANRHMLIIQFKTIKFIDLKTIK